MMYLRQFGQNLTIGSEDWVQTMFFHTYIYMTLVTMKICSRSPKSNHSFWLSQEHRLKAMLLLRPIGSTPKTLTPSTPLKGDIIKLFFTKFCGRDAVTPTREIITF